MTIRSWFDMTGKVAGLTAQLAGKTGELRAAHKTIGYWKRLAEDRWSQILKLHADVDEARRAAARGDAHLLIPPPAPSVLGSRDRTNALRLAAENAELRAEVERLEIALKEGNPS